jgi:hypothetical protein
MQFFGDGPGGSMGQPPINSKQVERYAELLGFDADQRDAALALLEGMQSEWTEGAKKIREEIDALREEFRESRDVSIWTERLPGMMARQREAATKLEKGFISDVQSLLTEEQQGGWPRFERAYRRDSTITRGRLSAESVDILSLAKDLPLSASSVSTVQPILDQYESDLDRALVARNQIVDEAQARVGMGPGALEQALQDEEFQKLREKAREARLCVRETNQRYARQIAAALPTDEATKFTDEFTRRSFPDVFRSTLTAESLAAASRFEDLTSDQQQSIASMRSAYAEVLERLNKSLMEATEKYEATSEGYAAALGGGMRFRTGGPGGESDDQKPDPIQEARTAKRDMERKALDNLKAILNDGQRDRLPKRRERGEGPRAMLSGGGPDAGGPGVFVLQRDGDAPPPDDGGGQVMHVIRQVEIGPDGKPIEKTGVFVQKLEPGQEPPEGEDVEIEYEVDVVHTSDDEHADDEEDADQPE